MMISTVQKLQRNIKMSREVAVRREQFADKQKSFPRSFSGGNLFCLSSPFTGVRTEELYFITLVLILIACSPSRGNYHGAVHEPPLRYAVNLNLLIINSYLFYDCFNSGFAVNGYNNNTCRSSDLSFRRCNYCVSDCLTKHVSDHYILAFSTLNSYNTVAGYY